MTLVELLVVISIIMILAVVVLPTMQPAAESRRLREAARALNVYLSSARNKAMETGRPCGVIFQRDTADGRFCFILNKAEVPPPYAGDFNNSTIKISNRSGNSAQVEFPQGDTPGALIRANDILQLNYQGHRWVITSISGTSPTWTWTFFSATTTGAPPETAGLPFKIFRQPVKSVGDPLQLPAGVVVDLSVSGTDSAAMGSGGVSPVIMFSPNGSIDRCYGPGGYRVFTDPIFFLLGQQDRPAVPTSTPPPEDELPNWIVPTNLWVSIGPQTGLVATAENCFVDPTGVTDWSTPNLAAARIYARQMQSMGGR